MKLQEYDYTIVYKTGKTHLEADCQSHHPQPMQTGDMDCNNDAFIFALAAGMDLAEEQNKDPALWQLKQQLRADLAHKHCCSARDPAVDSGCPWALLIGDSAFPASHCASPKGVP